MTALTTEFGRWLTILIMGFALGADAFSMGIGVGLRGIRLLDVLKISVIVGLFHMIMPLFGMLAGHYLGALLGGVGTVFGGCLLALLGAHMVYSSWRGEDAHSFSYRSYWGIVLFALGVSIDSFSVGISLGLVAADIVMTVFIFGAMGGAMSILGLMTGRHAASWFGKYGEAVGGMILLVCGLRFLM